MYEVINANLGIGACNLADLTAEQVGYFLKQWEEGAKIGTLTVFIECKTGLLVLNRDNRLYDTCRAIAEKYMAASPEARREIWGQVPESMIETLRVMEDCLKYRRIEKELFRARESSIGSKTSQVVLKEIFRRYDPAIAVSNAFQYGVMQGKRMERAKKKRQSITA